MHYSIYVRRGFLVAAFVFAVIPVFAQRPIPQNFSLQVHGQVRYAESDAPAEHILVRIDSFSGGNVGQMFTDRTGKFSFNGLQPQQYTVTVHAIGYLDVQERVDLQTSNTGYINAVLVRDRSLLSNQGEISIALTGIGVVNANIPIEAQNEYSKAKALIDEGGNEKIGDGIKHLGKAVAIFPNYIEAHLMLGIAYMDLRQWERAEKPLLKAIEINPEASTAYFALGEAYRRGKKYAEAEKILRDGLKLTGDSAEGHNTLAKLYWDVAPTQKDELKFKSSLEKSWKEVSKSLQLNPKFAEAHLLAGNLLLKARRAETALTHFEEYLKLEPKGEFAPDTKALIEKIKQALPHTGKK